jgi:hypothetical protein
MSDIKLFRIASGQINELVGTTDTIEKSVQILFEKNLDALYNRIELTRWIDISATYIRPQTIFSDNAT